MMDDLTPVNLSNLIQVRHKYDSSIFATNKDSLNMHWNIGQLTNKLHEVEFRIHDYPGTLHIVAISETWLNAYNHPNYQIMGYHAIHSVRSTPGGGMSLFIHDNLCKSVPKVLVSQTTAELHHFLVVEIPTINFSVAVSYNRPKGKTAEFMENLELLCLDKPNCVLMGDFNLDQLDTLKHAKLNDLLETHGFGLLNLIHPDAYTRLPSKTILDLVATNMLDRQFDISINHCAKSDHGILYTFVGRLVKHSPVTCVKEKFDLSKDYH